MSAAFEQQTNDFVVIVVDGLGEWTAVVAIANVDSGAVEEEVLDDILISLSTGDVKGGTEIVIDGGEIGSVGLEGVEFVDVTEDHAGVDHGGKENGTELEKMGVLRLENV